VVGHYQRIAQYFDSVRLQVAAQLIDALSAFMKHSGVTPQLQFPDADVRFLLDDKRAQVCGAAIDILACYITSMPST
jgi:hypothetical protein